MANAARHRTAALLELASAEFHPEGDLALAKTCPTRTITVAYQLHLSRFTGKAAYSIPAYSDRQPGFESNTAEGSATSTDWNRLRRRAPTLTHVRQQAS